MNKYGNQITFSKFIDIHEYISSSDLRNLDDIIKDTKRLIFYSESNADDDNDYESEPPHIPKLTDVANTFDVLRRYLNFVKII